MHVSGIAFLASLLLLGGESVLITKKGEKYEGPISKAGSDYVIQTITGPKRIPEAEVGIVFESLRDIMQRADDRFREAKRLFEEAKAMDEANPVRNQKLVLAVEISQGSVATYQLLQPHYTGSSYATIPNTIQLMMQFIRICRGAATSDVSLSTGNGKSGVVTLDDAVFAFSPPPSPLHLAGLLRLLESEKDVAVLQAASEGLAFMDTGLVLKSLGWARKETDPGKRAMVFSILRGAGDRAALDFLMDWFEEAPPGTHPDRAAFASLFRQFHAIAVPQLKDLLTKSRSPKVQTETIRQLGVIGDKAGGPMLLKTMASYTKDSAVSLLKIGKPAYQTLLEGGRSPDPETHRVCLHFLRKFSGIRQVNLTHFETWWGMNRKTVLEEEKGWWEEQSKKGWPVEPAAFATYDLPMESIVP